MSLKFGGDDYVRVPLPHNLDTNDESETDLDGVIESKTVETAGASNTPPNLWNFEFYQQHFNVDTSQMLVYDTQRVVGGRKYDLDEEEYIFGAMQLYVDVVMIFVALLGLSGSQC